VEITVEIHAEFPNGVNSDIERAVSENAKAFSFKNATWEESSS